MPNTSSKWFDTYVGDTPGDRLRAARLRAGYGKAVDAARAFGWEPPTYHAHENGTRGLTARAAEKYARAYRVQPSWLLFGGPHDGEERVPVSGQTPSGVVGPGGGPGGAAPGSAVPGGSPPEGMDADRTAPDDLINRTLEMLSGLIAAGNLHAAAETAEGLTHLLRARLPQGDAKSRDAAPFIP